MRTLRILAATVLAGALAPVGTAQAASRPPVVTIVLHGNDANVSGAKHLRAGWVTLRLSTTDKRYHDLYLGVARSGDAGPRGKGAMPPQGILRSTPTSGQSQSQAAIYARNAEAARASERSALSLGGVRVTRAARVDLTVKLPAGTTVLFGQVGPVAQLQLATKTGHGHGQPAGGASVIYEGADNVIHSPSTLSRNGVLRIRNSNPGDTTLHWITLNKVAPGATKASVQRWFGPDGYAGADPFESSPVTGSFNPLSAGHSEYVSYRGLPAGRYALVDSAVDEHSGHTHAEDGSIAFVTVT